MHRIPVHSLQTTVTAHPTARSRRQTLRAGHTHAACRMIATREPSFQLHVPRALHDNSRTIHDNSRALYDNSRALHDNSRAGSKRRQLRRHLLRGVHGTSPGHRRRGLEPWHQGPAAEEAPRVPGGGGEFRAAWVGGRTASSEARGVPLARRLSGPLAAAGGVGAFRPAPGTVAGEVVVVVKAVVVDAAVKAGLLRTLAAAEGVRRTCTPAVCR